MPGAALQILTRCGERELLIRLNNNLAIIFTSKSVTLAKRCPYTNQHWRSLSPWATPADPISDKCIYISAWLMMHSAISVRRLTIIDRRRYSSRGSQ